jgi:uncharacterized protein YdeI (BOF family)
MKEILKFLFTIIIVMAFSKISLGMVTNKRDGEYISLSGTVSRVGTEAFKLNVNGESILVEMDDYDDKSEVKNILPSDQVIVSGKIDHDFYEKKKIEAGSVYVMSLNKYFYANSNDEEDYNNSDMIKKSVKELPFGAIIDMKGMVVKVSDRKFVVDTGYRKIVVDTMSLGYNPLDNFGVTQIESGDRVHVTGRVDNSFYNGKEITANYVAEL